MTAIPRDKSIENTLALLNEAYTFIPSRCERLQSDVFETRLMLQKVICAMGEDAAAMFYQPDRFTRKMALPPTTLLLLQDLGSVQLLDGEAHRRRKEMFMSLMKPEQISGFSAIFKRHWLARIPAWSAKEEIVFHQEVEKLLCAAVCEWVGVPLTQAAVRQRTKEFSAMIEGAGAVGPRNWRGLLRRSRTEDWARSIINNVRAGYMRVPPGTATEIIAMHRDADGRLLDTKVAAVELINVMRPTVAVARYVTFAALALHRYPECRQKLISGDKSYLEGFVQEVRRFYPFFPAVGGRALVDFEWRGMRIEKGTWVLLDVYGTNHDERIWGDPWNFRPERFIDWKHSDFSLIPQGGGDVDFGHRCAGEWLTVQTMKTAVRLLVTAMEYEIPRQDLRINLYRMPAIPTSRLVMRQVHATGDAVSRERSLDRPGDVAVTAAQAPSQLQKPASRI
ncbi:cytochrome P450 [Herbaspirillum sp. GCM10030257]|uniref:cytochrome P450 n=1 Tax=Herbaspirillum sp. GCM10030257 TaxID=3273393 RepID=UPI003613FCA4